MSDDSNGKISPPGWLGRAWSREREISGVQPFFRLRYRGRERSISRVVAIPRGAREEGGTLALEIFFGLG